MTRILLLLALIATPVLAHDHSRPGLDKWFQSLNSRKGPCCDGPNKDALHLAEVDWESQHKAGHGYRVRVPKSVNDFAAAMRGEKVVTEWVDVPDDAVIHEPNLAGQTLVWPMYGYMGNTIRCFMIGSLS